MVFRLCQRSEKRWRRLNEYGLIENVIANVAFIDGEKRQAA